ncbi:MAG: alanine racemase [Gammaproteobacteria bacterium]|nr:alanine racemase [Gammaproteobacteria bacterium]
MKYITDLSTPCLLIEKNKLDKNIQRINQAASKKSLSLRLHLKTVKSVEGALYILPAKDTPIAVSTLKEAEILGKNGITDILYTVAIPPQKLDQVASLIQNGINLKVIVDSLEMAKAVTEYSNKNNLTIPCFIEIDVDGHRSGLTINDEAMLIDIAKQLSQNNQLLGLMAHAGESYSYEDPESLLKSANNEVEASVKIAEIIRSNGIDCPEISIGSTPTALTETDQQGATELRAGVCVFFDLFQTGVGVCDVKDIALSVLTTVIGTNSTNDRIMIDAGWMALSRDRGTANQKVDQFYGLVCDESGNLVDGLVVKSVNQEHGIIEMRDTNNGKLPEMPIGTRLRILTNHACATSAQHGKYYLMDGEQICSTWDRFNGW